MNVSKSPARIAGMFDSIARRYDLLNHLLSAGIDRRWRARAIASLNLTGRETVIDVCSGTADLAIAAIRRSRGAKRAIGVDFAAEMLRVGFEKVRRDGLRDRIALVRGDATRLPVASGSADGVTIGFGIRNVEETATACREIARVLKPGGRFAILEFAMPTVPVARQIYGCYFRRVLPLVGRAISRHGGAYDYLPASVAAFATPDELVTLLQDAGFRDISAVPLTLGIVFLYTGTRR